MYIYIVKFLGIILLIYVFFFYKNYTFLYSMIIIKFFYEKLYTIYINIIFIQIIYVNNKKKKKKKRMKI